MIDQTKVGQNNAFRLETALQAGKNFVRRIKKRELQSELRDIKYRSQLKIYERSRQFQNFSYRKTFRRRREGIALSFGLAKRNVSRSKYRSTLLILGVILTVALETGIVVSVDTLYDDFLLDHRNQNYTDITIHPTSWHNMDDLQDVSRAVKHVSGVSKSSPVFYTSVNQFLGETISGANVLVYGIDAASHPDFPHVNITDGKRVVNDNTIIISQRIQEQTGVQVDEIINLGSLGYDFESVDVTIGGVMSDEPFFGNKIGFSFILVDIDTLYEIIPDNRKTQMLNSEIDVEVSNLVNIKRIGENVKDFVGVTYYVFTEKDISEIEATGIRAYQTAMNLVILASFVVEFLFITNVLAISIRDRSREFGILRAVGTGSYQLIESVAAELLIYSTIGCSIGLVTGIGFSNVLVGIMDYFYVGLEFQGLSLHSSSLIATFISGMLVALISGLYPIIIAISMPVVQNIHSRMRRGSTNGRITNSWKYTIITGILLSLVGFSLQFFVGPSRFLDFELLSVHFLTVLLIFIGTLFLEMGILVFLPRIAMRTLIGFNIVTRTISTRNIAREFQKSLFTILTSALALTFIIVVGLVSAAVIAGVPAYFQSQWGAIDLVAETSDTYPLSTNYTSYLENDYRISMSSFIQESRTDISEVEGYVYGVDPSKYAFFAEPIIDSIGDRSSYVYLNQSRINRTNGLISHILFQKLNIPLGSNVSIKIADNSTVNVTLTCVIKANVFLGNGEYLYISSTRFQEFYRSIWAKWFICDVEGNVESVQRSLEVGTNFKNVMAITFFAEMMERSLVFQSALFQVLFVESFILAAIAQFICILVSTLRMEREIGIMRSLGLTRRGVFGIFLTESIALGVSALFVGLIDGLLGSVLLAGYISRSIPISINFSYMSIILWLIISFLITIFSTILPSYRSSRKNIVATMSGRPMTKDHVEIYPHDLKATDRVFYSPWGSSSRSINPISYSRLPFTKPVEMKNVSSQSISRKKQIESIGVFSYIRRNALQVQTVFLVLMAIITFNYIFDENIIIQGLNPFDFLIRSFISIPLPGYGYDYYDAFIAYNPLFVIVGVAAIIPISNYLSHKENSGSFVRNSIVSLFWGITGIVLILITTFLFIVVLSVFFTFIQEKSFASTSEYYTPNIFLLFLLICVILIAVLVFYLYNKVWSFLIINGFRQDIDFSDKIRLLRQINSQGMIGFTIILLLHSFLQLILFYILIPIPNIFEFQQIGPPYIPSRELTLGPIEFMVFTFFEVGFYLLLIIYQIVQFEKFGYTFQPTDVPSSEIIRTSITNPEIISRCQLIADEILMKNVRGINIKHGGQLLFSEAINGANLLFYQVSSLSTPVAMNFSRHYPQKHMIVSPTNQLSVMIPSVHQMEQFLELTIDLKLIE